MRERFDWPDAADTRVSLRQGELLFLSRWQQAGGGKGTPPAAAFALPYAQAGPVTARGMLRLAPDPLGFSAWSGVYHESTSLSLDSSLSSSWRGLVLTPLPGLCGVFARQREDGTESGAFLSIPLGAGASAEGMLLRSQPVPALPAEEWFLPGSPFPGGEVTHLGGRLFLESPRFDCSFTMLGSSPQRAAPGTAASLWVRGRSPEMEQSLLVSTASTAYRSPAGACVTSGYQVSAAARVGGDRTGGTLTAGWAFTAGKPEFGPHQEVPSRTLLRLDFTRDYAAPGLSLSLLLHADKEMCRDADGTDAEEARCGWTLCVFPGGMAVKAGAGLSNAEGASVSGGLILAPGSPLRFSIEMKAAGLGAAPSASGGLTVSITRGGSASVLFVGVEDYPLGTREAPRPGNVLRCLFRRRCAAPPQTDGMPPSVAAECRLRRPRSVPVPDQDDFPLQLESETGAHLLLDLLDQRAHVRGACLAGVDEDVAVIRGDLRAAEAAAFQAEGVDQLAAGRAKGAVVLEDAAGAGVAEVPLLLAVCPVGPHALPHFRRVSRNEAERGGQHDAARLLERGALVAPVVPVHAVVPRP